MATALKLRSDIKKLKKGLEAKGVSASLKEKLKSQLQKAENELASLKKTGKAPKKSSVAGTKVALTALQKLIQKKKYGVYQGAGVDLKKDAGEGALATGRRESKGLKSNQYGDKSDNKGNVYYEYRPNRLDVKQPKKRQSYPKLEKGGYMAKGGKTIGHTIYFEPMKNLGGKSIQSNEEIRGNYRDMDKVLDKKLGDNYLGSTFYINDGYGKILLENDKDGQVVKSVLKMFDFEDASSQYMARGGSVTEIDMAEVESSAKYYTDESRWSRKPTIEKFKEDISEYQELKRKLDNKEITPSKIIGTGIKPNLARPLAYRWLNERTMVAKRAIEILEERGSKMASGGYMAEGGEVKVGDKVKYKNAKYHATVIEVIDDAEIPYAKIEYSDGRIAKAYLEDLQKVQLAMAKEYVNPNYMASGGMMAKASDIKEIGKAITEETGIEKNDDIQYGSLSRIEVEQVLLKEKNKLLKYKGRFVKDSHREIPFFDEIINDLKKDGWNIIDTKGGKMASGGYMAKGGLIQHGLEYGDKIINSSGGNVIEVESKSGDRFLINLDKGKRLNKKEYTMDSATTTHKDFFMAKGGYMAEGGVTSTTHRMSK